MVQVDGSDDAHLVTLLGMQLLSNGFVGNGAGLVHVDGAGIGLVAGGNGSCGGSEVRCE